MSAIPNDTLRLLEQDHLLANPSLEEFPTDFTLTAHPEYEVWAMDVAIPGGTAYGEILMMDDELTAVSENIKVTEGLRQGKGAYLVKVLAREAMLRGVSRLVSDIMNPTAMRNRGRIFGEKALHFYEKTDLGYEPGHDLSALLCHQAAASLERDEEGDCGILTVVDLQDADVKARLMQPAARREYIRLPDNK